MPTEDNKDKNYCIGCEEYVFEPLNNDYGYKLCDECNEKYHDVTGFCSLSCCLGGGCDESC